MCRVYSVSREGYYAWKSRGLSARRQQDAELLKEIKRVFVQHEGCYGSPKIMHELRKKSVRVGQKRVARVMSEHGLKARKARLYRSCPGTAEFQRHIPNRIVDMKLTAPNQLWVGDVTYIKLMDGTWQYLAVMMDRFSRRIISWSLSDKRDLNLSLCALERAVRNRGQHQALIFHSDRGSEYMAFKYRERLSTLHIAQSINRVKKMNDNAFIESFFHYFKTERLKGVVLRTKETLRAIVSEYMRYYNFERSHSALGYRAPAEFERIITT